MDLSNYRGLRRYLAGDYNNPETLYKLAISRHQESGLFFFFLKKTNKRNDYFGTFSLSVIFNQVSRGRQISWQLQISLTIAKQYWFVIFPFLFT